jgi:hypothetical protein
MPKRENATDTRVGMVKCEGMEKDGKAEVTKSALLLYIV